MKNKESFRLFAIICLAISYLFALVSLSLTALLLADLIISVLVFGIGIFVPIVIYEVKYGRR